MPFFHNQDLNPMSYDICGSYPLYGEMRPKRKLDVDETLNHMETKQNWAEQLEEPFTHPKRLCLNLRDESNPILPVPAQEETLPGCLKDTIVSAYHLPCVEHSYTEESQAAPMPVNPTHIDMEEDLSHHIPSSLNGENDNHCDIDDPGASMETDFVPDSQQYNVSLSHTPPTSSSGGGYCGGVTCRGLKPSPVTGRFHCHCYASWRGMYGIDCYFSSDYY